MGKSQETFSKKEKEKNKIKKRKEKEEKKEERKANKGNGMDDMIAYVDENGRLSSTPPDLTKKIVINSEDIKIGVSKQEDIEVDPIRAGVVSFFNDSKGYGFIRDTTTQESFFVHINSVNYAIKENDKVNFEIEMGPKGANAVSVKLQVKV